MKPPAADAPAVDLDDVDMDLDVDVDVAEVEPDTDLDTDAPAVADTGPELGERERQILAFEAKWWKHAGSKEQAIRDAFELSATRYYQILNGLLNDPAALAYDPVLVGRLRRLRSTRSRTRRR